MTKKVFLLVYLSATIIMGTYYYVAAEPVSEFYGLGVLLIITLLYIRSLYKKPKPQLIEASEGHRPEDVITEQKPEDVVTEEKPV